MLLLDSFLIPTLHESSEDPKGGVSCIFNGFLNIFISWTFSSVSERQSEPTFISGGIGTWHLTTLPALPPLSSNIASWGQTGVRIRMQFPQHQTHQETDIHKSVEGREGLYKCIFLTSIQLGEQINLSFIYFIFRFYCINIYFFKCKVIFTK